MMKTTLEYNTETDEYFAKPSQLQVVMGKENTLTIAETDLNLAKYSKTQQITDRLPLLKLVDNESVPVIDDDYIEIIVKTNILEGEAETPTAPGLARTNT